MRPRLWSGGVATGVAVLVSCSPAIAATITVNTSADELTNNGNCSLREALEAANNDTAVDGCAKGSGADTVGKPAGSYESTAGTLGTYHKAGTPAPARPQTDAKPSPGVQAAVGSRHEPDRAARFAADAPAMS